MTIINEQQLRGIIRESLKTTINTLYESSMNRIHEYVKNYECAIITAWRDELKDVTDNTFKPNHIYHEKGKRGNKIVGEPFSGDNNKFNTREKKFYNTQLKDTLRKYGYGVIKVRGSYREYGKQEAQEESYFVVNLNDEPDFKKKMFEISEYYNQDSFMYSPKGTDEGFLIGTNKAAWPGYGNEEPSNKFKRDVQSIFMSRIGNRGFSFTNGDRINPNDPKRKEKLSSDDNNYETDRPMTFQDRKKERIKNSTQFNKNMYNKNSIADFLSARGYTAEEISEFENKYDVELNKDIYDAILDRVFDYSCGWGARMLAAWSLGLDYSGTDPLVVDDLKKFDQEYLGGKSLILQAKFAECV